MLEHQEHNAVKKNKANSTHKMVVSERAWLAHLTWPIKNLKSRKSLVMFSRGVIQHMGTTFLEAQHIFITAQAEV